MQIGALDHVNVRTTQVDAMADWYERILGMRRGRRPDFPFPGAWLYAGSHPAVHLVGVEGDPSSIEPKIEHFAFTATGLKELTARLDKMGIEYRAVRVPGFNVLQGFPPSLPSALTSAKRLAAFPAMGSPSQEPEGCKTTRTVEANHPPRPSRECACLDSNEIVE